MRVIGAPTRAIANRFGISIVDVNAAVDGKIMKLDNGYRVRAVALDLKPFEEMHLPSSRSQNSPEQRHGRQRHGIERYNCDCGMHLL